MKVNHIDTRINECCTWHLSTNKCDRLLLLFKEMIDACLSTHHYSQVNLLFNNNSNWRRTNFSLLYNLFGFSSNILGKHKWCTATVTLREGTGKVTIKSPSVKTCVNDILYFTRIIHRFVHVLVFSRFYFLFFFFYFLNLTVINCCIHSKY